MEQIPISSHAHRDSVTYLRPEEAARLLASDYAGKVDTAPLQKPVAAAPERQVRHLAA